MNLRGSEYTFYVLKANSHRKKSISSSSLLDEELALMFSYCISFIILSLRHVEIIVEERYINIKTLPALLTEDLLSAANVRASILLRRRSNFLFKLKKLPRSRTFLTDDVTIVVCRLTIEE